MAAIPKIKTSISQNLVTQEEKYKIYKQIILLYLAG